MRLTMKALCARLLSEAQFSLECETETVDYRGNCSAIDEKTDREAEKWISDQLDAGNDWAWCSVTVTASYRGFTGQDHLGCCSYLSAEDFKTPGGYYDDMRREAAARLAEQLIGAVDVVRSLGFETGQARKGGKRKRA